MAIRKQAPKQQPNPDELVEVIWSDTRQEVKIPRRLLQTANKRAQKDWLIAHGEIADPNATPLPDMQEPAEVVQQVVDNGATAALDARLSALEGRKQQELPTDDALAEWSRQAQRVALSHQEMNAVAEQTATACEQVGRDAQQRLDGLDEQQAAMLGKVSEAVSEGQTSVGLAIQSLEQRSAAIRSEALEVAETNAIEVATKEGRKAAKQVAEAFRPSSVTIASEDPREVDENSWALRHYGFEGGLVAGDGVFVTSAHGITAMVFKGPQQGWVETAELLPRVVTATGPSITDNSKPQYSTIVQSSTGGSSGPSSIRLLASTTARGATTRIADTSNYAAVNLGGTPHSGKLLVQVTDTGTARVGVATIDFIIDASGTLSQTDSALMGQLFSGTNPPEVNLQGIIRAPQFPTGITPPAAGSIHTQALQLDIVVGAGMGIGGPYLLAGDLSLAFEGGDTPIDQKTGIVPAPLWVWS